jgi:hypothetical protein
LVDVGTGENATGDVDHLKVRVNVSFRWRKFGWGREMEKRLYPLCL